MWEEVLVDALRWLRVSGSRILLIVAVAVLALRLLHLVADRLVRFAGDEDPTVKSEREKRAETLGSILRTVGRVAVLLIAAMMVLGEVGLDITPIVAGAGIVGLAVGFGAQSLVKDVLAGFFILLENQFGVGDVIQAADVTGVVERTNLRVTVLRDLEGRVHFIPNGDIGRVSNLTKEWSRVVLDVGVAYREQVDRALEVLREVGRELRADPEVGRLIVEEPAVLGVEALGDSAVTLRMLVKTLPLKQWDVARELRRRVKNSFDARGIEIPFPHRTTYLRFEEPEVARLARLAARP